jgi:hypothetical protein
VGVDAGLDPASIETKRRAKARRFSFDARDKAVSFPSARDADHAKDRGIATL